MTPSETGMRNILGDDDDDVAFRPLIRTRDERKGVERRRTDGQRGINSRVVKIPDAPAAPASLSLSLTFSLARNVE